MEWRDIAMDLLAQLDAVLGAVLVEVVPPFPHVLHLASPTNRFDASFHPVANATAVLSLS